MIDWVQLIYITNELPLKNDIPRAFLVITWTKSTTPSPIITWVGVASKASIYMGIISTIWLMLNLSVRVPRPCLYMLGSPSKNLSIRVCKTVLHPFLWKHRFENTRSSRDVLKQRNIIGAYLRKNTFLSWYLKEGSSYYANKMPNKQYKMQSHITC